jgi:CheY-like chemotaxis protein
MTLFNIENLNLGSLRFWRRKTIVVYIDDARELLKLSELLVRGTRCQIFPFSNGPDALAFMESFSGQIDHVLLDMAMHGMDGIEVFRRLRTEPLAEKLADTPVTILSAAALDDTQWSALERYGVCSLVRKNPAQDHMFLRILEHFKLVKRRR